MAAIRINRISSSIVGAFVVALAAALLVAGAIGYLVRPAHAPMSVSATQGVQPTVRAAAQLPAAIEQYLRPTQAPPSAEDQLPASERQYIDR